MAEKIKSWWSDDGKWFCLRVNDGVARDAEALAVLAFDQLEAWARTKGLKPVSYHLAPGGNGVALCAAGAAGEHYHHAVRSRLAPADVAAANAAYEAEAAARGLTLCEDRR